MVPISSCCPLNGTTTYPDLSSLLAFTTKKKETKSDEKQ